MSLSRRRFCRWLGGSGLIAGASLPSSAAAFTAERRRAFAAGLPVHPLAHRAADASAERDLTSVISIRSSRSRPIDRDSSCPSCTPTLPTWRRGRSVRGPRSSISSLTRPRRLLLNRKSFAGWTEATISRRTSPFRPRPTFVCPRASLIPKTRRFRRLASWCSTITAACTCGAARKSWKGRTSIPSCVSSNSNSTAARASRPSWFAAATSSSPSTCSIGDSAACSSMTTRRPIGIRGR